MTTSAEYVQVRNSVRIFSPKDLLALISKSAWVSL